MTSILILALAVAGFAHIWRKLKRNHPRLREAIGTIPEPLQTAVRCTSCFTYWLSLAAVLIVQPLPQRGLLPLAISWMAVSALGVAFVYSLELLRGATRAHHGAHESLANHSHV